MKVIWAFGVLLLMSSIAAIPEFSLRESMKMCFALLFARA
jgi:hypothetical protein